MDDYFPKTATQAFHRLGIVEDKKTTVLHIFGYNPFTKMGYYSDIKRSFRLLATMVHPDRNPKDKGSADRSTRTLNRAFEIVEAEIEFERLRKLPSSDGEIMMGI